MDLFRNIKVLSLEQATVLPFLTYRLAMDGCRVIRLEHPVFGDPDYSTIKQDLKRIGVLAGTFIAILVVLAIFQNQLLGAFLK